MGSATVSGPVNINNGATLTARTISSGANNVTFGPGGVFAPGNNGEASGITNIITASGSVVTATPQTSPGNLTAVELAYGNGISPTNVVGSIMTLYVGKRQLPWALPTAA